MRSCCYLSYRTFVSWLQKKKVPPGLTTPEAAVAGTMVYATAWLALHWQARIRKGDRVLIHSAAGGVGLAAVSEDPRLSRLIHVSVPSQNHALSS